MITCRHIVLDDDADTTYWMHTNDPPSDDGDLYCWQESGGFDVWAVLTNGPRTVDFGLKMGFFPLNHTPNPEDIGLRINGSGVSGYPSVNGSGYWLTHQNIRVQQEP